MILSEQTITLAESFAKVGLVLKQTRQKKKLKAEDIAKSLKIRLSYLDAIEEGRFSDLPGPIYSFGYLKLYSDLLNLNSTELLKEFKEIAEAMALKESRVLQGDPYNHEIRPQGTIIAIALLMMLAVYFFWYYAIYFPARINWHEYSRLQERHLMDKAKELYGMEE